MHEDNLEQHYGNYLELDKILDAQHPVSRKLGDEKHDEMLFIIVHQAHELWFKQILHEINSILEIFSHDVISDKALLKLARRLQRVRVIQQILLKQIEALNTLTPMEFLEFRDALMPASGFQSIQFRLLEIKLGIQKKQLTHCLSDSEITELKNAQNQTNLFEQLSRWLERTPFLKTKNFDFWRAYQTQVTHLLEKDLAKIDNNNFIPEDEKISRKREITAMQARFQSFFEKESYQALIDNGERRMGFEASHAALFIFLYRDHPALQIPYQILSHLIQIDQNLTSWRSKHLLMVQRVIGAKMGTGGSSGVNYLNQGVQHQAFADLTSLSTFMLPSSALPELPQDLTQALGFFQQISE